MLSLLCKVFDEPGTRLPLRRAELYERCLQGLLADWKDQDKRQEITLGQVDLTIRRASKAALALYPLSQFSESKFADAIGSEDGLKTAKKLIDDGVLIRAGSRWDSPLMFLHRTFHEYLAARQWDSEPWNPEFLEKRCWDVAWHPVIVLMVGLQENPKTLHRAVNKQENG